MRFLLIGIVVALLIGLALGMFFSTNLRTALQGAGVNVMGPATAGGATGSNDTALSISPTPTVGGISPSPASVSTSSTSTFHGLTSYPHVIGPAARCHRGSR